MLYIDSILHICKKNATDKHKIGKSQLGISDQSPHVILQFVKKILQERAIYVIIFLRDDPESIKRGIFMDRAQLKAQAKAQIKGKIGILFLISLVIAAISGIAGWLLVLIPVVGPIISAVIIVPAFSLSMVRVFLLIVKGTKPEVKDAFCGFDDFWSAFKLTFFVGLFTFLWSLLFVIPGIIKGISYSMSFYILAENKGKPALACINESKEMTNGHKADLFVLGLSFIGWMLLGSITLGIAYIWILPYMGATFTNAYLSLKPAPVEAAPVEEIPAAPAE